MYVIKHGDKYIKFGEDGWIKDVKNIDEATHLKTKRISEITANNLINESHYENISVEEIDKV